VEMLGSMYDASLDAFTPHSWSYNLSQYFYNDISNRSFTTVGGLVQIQPYENEWNQTYGSVELSYRSFIDALQLPVPQMWGARIRMMKAARGGGGLMNKAMAMPMDAMAAPASAMVAESTVERDESKDGASDPFSAAEPAPKVDTSTVSPRKNLQETAFFEPQLTTDEKGIVKMTFTMPEALTKWKFMGIAHDTSLRSGYLEGEAVTSKDLMCQPNPPRFLREGDEIEFTAKISNQSDKPQQGQARLSFADAATM
jgi:hypothetical protein